MAEYLKIPEVADLLGLSEQTVRRRVKSGELPSVFIGGVYRISRTALDEYLEQARVEPGKAEAPHSQPESQEERRGPTQEEIDAVNAVADFCDQLAGFLIMAEREDVSPDLWAMQRYMITQTARANAHLMDSPVVGPMLRPAAARLVELAQRFEDSAQRAGVSVATENTGNVVELAKRFARAG